MVEGEEIQVLPPVPEVDLFISQPLTCCMELSKFLHSFICRIEMASLPEAVGQYGGHLGANDVA